jgi:toxin ParE1/3/4
MAEIVLSKKAAIDLEDIWNYTFDNWSEKQADIYYESLTESFQDIKRNPNIGKSYFSIIDDLKGYKISKHIIFYRILDKELIRIERILHERMDLGDRITDT